jgi:heme A synthase
VPEALIAAALLYSAWLLSYALHVNVGTVDGYVSELPARDQPYRWIFAGGDLASGILLAAVGTAVAVGTSRAPWLVRAAWWALAVFGLFTVLDVAFPLDCAPSVSAVCFAAEQGWTVSAAHRIHVVTSVVANTAVLVHMGAAARTERRERGTCPWLGPAAAPLVVVDLVGCLAVLALVPSGKWVGIPQRVSVLGVAVWLTLLRWGLAKERIREWASSRWTAPLCTSCATGPRAPGS